jgi:hypothetical protein
MMAFINSVKRMSSGNTVPGDFSTIRRGGGRCDSSSRKGSMVMITQARSTRGRLAAVDKQLAPLDRTDRLIRLALGIYLLPALLVVLVVGGLGMLAIAVAKRFEAPIHRSVG